MVKLGIVGLANTGALNDAKGNQNSAGYKNKSVTSKDRGNSQQYRKAKLKRDFLEIAEHLCNGEFKNEAEAERAAKITVCFFDSQAILARLISLM